MFKVVLVFPDSVSLAEFVLQERLRGIETNCSEYLLSGQLTEEQIKKARKIFKAFVRVARKVG
jgi:hypothetical protein